MEVAEIYFAWLAVVYDAWLQGGRDMEVAEIDSLTFKDVENGLLLQGGRDMEVAEIDGICPVPTVPSELQGGRDMEVAEIGSRLDAKERSRPGFNEAAIWKSRK